MEDARCLLDVISDPLALNAFLEQEQNAKQRQNAQIQNVTHATSTQPGTSLAGHQYLLKQQQLQQQTQQPQVTTNQITILGSPMPPPSQSPMAPSPMNLPVGSPLVAHGSPMMSHGSPMAMVARSPQQPPSPQVQTILHQVPSPAGGTRTSSPMMMRQPQLLPKPTMNTTAIVQQQAAVGQPTLQIQKALPQSVTQSLSVPVPVQPGITNKVHNASNTLHYQPQATTSMISTIQNSSPISLQGSTILQTSSGKFLLPSGVRLQNLQQFLTSPQSGAGQQVVLQNQIVPNTQQVGLGMSTNANLVNYSQQPSQIVIQSAGGAQQGNIILRTLPSVLPTANQNTGNSVQNGQKTILIAPQQNLGQFQTTAGAVSLNQQTNVNLLPKTMPVQNGNVMVNIGGQNITLQHLKNLQAMNAVAGPNKLSNLNIQFSQANMNSVPQMTSAQSQPAVDSTNQTLNFGNQIYINHLNQGATKTSTSVPNPITSTTQLVSNVIAAQSKILAAKSSSSSSSSKKQIQIQRAGEANRRSPGTKGGGRAQLTSNQTVTNSSSTAGAHTDNILSQAINICNLEFDPSKSAGLVSNNSTSKTLTVPSSQFGSVPTPVSRQTVPSTAVNVSNVTFSRVIPSVSSTAVTFNSSAANISSIQPLTVNSLYQNHKGIASSEATIFSSPSNVQYTLSSSLSLSTMVTHSSVMAAKPVMSQLDVKPAVTQFLDVKPVVSQFMDMKPLVAQFANVKPAVSQYAVASQFLAVKPPTSQLDVKPVLSQLNVQKSSTSSTLVLQSAQSGVPLSTAITTIAASKMMQCPTISSSTAVPISSTTENNTPALTQVHLSQQAQVALQTVQAQLKLLLAKKERTPEEDVRLQKLYEVQRKIIAHGRQNALKRQEQLQQLVANNPTVAFASPQTSVVSQQQVTDAKTAIAGIQNMHNVPAPNVTILKSGHIASVAETKTTVIPAGVKILSQGVQGGKTQTITKVVTTDEKSVAVPTQVKVANHIITVNLTTEQKAKFEEQLAKLTPEQQEVFYKHQVNLQQKQQRQVLLKQQQLQGQNVAEMKQESGVLEQVTPGTNEIKPIITTSPLTTTFTSNRGIKRISTGALHRTSLLHQQLLKDQAAVLAPNCKAPFTTPNEACRRLLRYHVYHEKESPRFIRQKEEANFEDYVSDILQKRRKMLDCYQMLLLDESMRPQPTSELVMMERMFLQEEREQLANDRRRSKEDPDNFIPTPVTTHTQPDVVEILPSTATCASFTTPATSSSGRWTPTNTHSLNKVASAANPAYSQHSDIPEADQQSAGDKSIPSEKPKLGVKLIIKRNYKDISGADSYVAASHNPGGESPHLPKDYEDFRTNLSRNSVQSEASDLETESQATSRDTSDQENSRESGGYICAAGYTDDLDNSDAKEEAMDTGISGGDDTITTDGDQSQSEDVMAVDSLLHSDLDIDEQAVSDNDDPIEITDFFSNVPDNNLTSERRMLCDEFSVLNGLENVEEEDLGDQMQSAIDSILSLQNFQNFSFPWPTTFASTQMTQSMLPDSFGGQSQGGDEDSSGSENDLDAAVQSIL
ncbi:uncharacterized protein LOC135492033 isoform X2 [Lineus longissimus]|uniref:uncharacterized protein LOC135492033 isoform X2 n=1 Tax=Lineus longissimus TaxID=88925 RepID=UPI00315DAD71